MSFIAKLQRAREILEQQGRVSTRALDRELDVGGEELEEIIEELVDVQGLRGWGSGDRSSNPQPPNP